MSSELIKKQVEFYFSDSNFRKDTFLRAAAETDPEGFVPIAVLLTFNRLKSLSSDANVIAAALKDSDAVVVSEDNLKIRRAQPLPETDCSKECTLYVKGFPVDDSDVTIESITKQFSKYGHVNMVRLRKDVVSKGFKGSCFVEYSNANEVAAAVADAYDGTQVKLKFKEQPFDCVMPLVEWLSKKEDKKNKRTSEPVKKVVEQVKPEFTKGLIVKLKNVASDTNPMALKEFLINTAEVKFVEVADGEATVRVADNEAADKLLKACESGLAMENSEKFTAELVTGEEEEKFWVNLLSGSKKRGGGGRGGGGRGRGGGGRGRGGGRKRQRV